MRLPVPGPRDVLAAIERGGDQIEALIGAVPRMLALLDVAEGLLDRASGAVDRVSLVVDSAAAEVVRVGAVVDVAALEVQRVASVVDRADVEVARVTELLDAMVPSLVILQPTLETLAETTHPDEVKALVGLIDHLPELTARMESDVMPVLATLGSVAPDIHDMLTVTRELNDMLAKVPGIRRIKRRIDEQEGEDQTEAPTR